MAECVINIVARTVHMFVCELSYSTFPINWCWSYVFGVLVTICLDLSTVLEVKFLSSIVEEVSKV